MDETTRDNVIDLINENTRLKTEIERLRDVERMYVEQFLDQERVATEQAKEIERLRQQVTQRGARMQVMHDYLTQYSSQSTTLDYLTQYSSQSTTLWRDFCRVCPEAAAWFDDEGVPR